MLLLATNTRKCCYNFVAFSLELGNCIAVALEGAINHICAVVVHVRHHGLVHAAVPLYETRVTVSVAVTVLVVLMEYGLLASHPLAMSIGHWGVGRKNAGDVPVEQVGVVSKRLGIESMVVQNDRSVVTETTANTTDNEVHNPHVGKTHTHIEVLNWQFTNSHQTE